MGFLKLSQTDLKLLSELQADCKQSLKEISKKLKIPLSTAYDRIKRFEKEGIIKNYSALIDSKKVGRETTTFILVSIKYQFPGDKTVSQREIAQKISRIPLVQEVHIIAGEWDLLLKVNGSNLGEIGSFVIDKLREIKGVDKTLTLQTFYSYKETPAIPLGDHWEAT